MSEKKTWPAPAPTYATEDGGEPLQGIPCSVDPQASSSAGGNARIALDASRFQRVMQILGDALDQPVEARHQFLVQACGGDDALRNEIEDLLQANASQGNFLETPAVALVDGSTVAREPPEFNEDWVWSCPNCLAIYREGGEFCDRDGTRLEFAADPLIGTQIDRYLLEEPLGDGASGRVYRARHTFLECEYAVKVLYGDRARDEKFVARFQREAQAVSRMRHPNVISVVDFVTSTNGLMFLVMELVHGTTLSEALRAGAMSPARAAEIARGIASGLAEAHEHGFVHRDLKPSNVMLERWRSGEHVKILDFGVVGLEPGSPMQATLTGTGRTVGTPVYMSPEQLRDSRVSGEADLYALGAILFEMLTGKKAFSGPLMEIVRAKDQGRIEPMPDAFGLERLVHQLLEVQPGARPPGALSVVEWLDRLDLSSVEAHLPIVSVRDASNVYSHGTTPDADPDTDVSIQAVNLTTQDGFAHPEES